MPSSNSAVRLTRVRSAGDNTRPPEVPLRPLRRPYLNRDPPLDGAEYAAKRGRVIAQKPEMQNEEARPRGWARAAKVPKLSEVSSLKLMPVSATSLIATPPWERRDVPRHAAHSCNSLSVLRGWMSAVSKRPNKPL